MLALGALTPLAGSLLSASMFTAIRKVHWAKGPWNTSGGYEYNLVLMAAVAALVDGGPGKPSVDTALGIDDTGARWALASIAAGAGGSALATEAVRRFEPEPEPRRRFVRGTKRCRRRNRLNDPIGCRLGGPRLNNSALRLTWAGSDPDNRLDRLVPSRRGGSSHGSPG